MGVTRYSSTDAGAPTLSGTVGDLVNLLDKCLVTGYGSKSPLGWSKPYTGTNKAAFRQPVGTNRFYLRVDDNTPTGGPAGGQIAAVRGYEVMTDVDTGTGLFPTVAQETNGLAWAKSTTSSAATRAWELIGDEAGFYLFTDYNGTGADWSFYPFGDFVPYKPGDAFHTGIHGGIVSTASSNYTQTDMGSFTSSAAGTNQRSYVARSYSQLGSSVAYGKAGTGYAGGSSMLSTGLGYPAAINNGLFISGQVRVLEGGQYRGLMPGLYYSENGGATPDLRVESSVPGFAGRSLLLKKFNPASGNTGYCAAIDITGPWR